MTADGPATLPRARVTCAKLMTQPESINQTDGSTQEQPGSRWVDAEALRLACLHVAGRAS